MIAMDGAELLGRLISINSVFPNEAELGLFLEQHLQSLGFKVKKQPVEGNRFNVLAEKDGNGECVMFYGHMDTVAPHGKWDSDPFVLRRGGDRLYGLGTWDMKGGLTAILKAVEGTKHRVKIAFCCDEENVSKGVNALLKSDFLEDVKVVVVAESGLNNKGITGPGMITLGRRGHVVFFVHVEGKAAHGGTPEAGINAISEAAKLITKLDEMNKTLRKHELLPPETQYVCRIAGFTESLSIPDKAHFEVDRHLVAPETAESALKGAQEYVKKLCDSGEIRAKVTIHLKERDGTYPESYITPKDNEYVKKLDGIVKKEMGSVYHNYALSVADENFLATRKTVITIGPAGESEHAANEWVSEKSIGQLTRIYKAFLEG